MCIYIIGLPAERYISERRDGPGRGGFLNWMLVSEESAAFMWMGQQWHFQAIRYVTAQRETQRPAQWKGKWQVDEWNMRWWTWSVSAFAKESYFHFVDRAHFFMPFFLFFFPGRRETDCPLSAVMVRGGRMRACSEVKQKVRPVSILLYCAISCRLCILKMHCLAFGSFFFFE